MAGCGVVNNYANINIVYKTKCRGRTYKRDILTFYHKFTEVYLLFAFLTTLGYSQKIKIYEESIMANKEHLDHLKQGVNAWNHWRKNTKIIPDLSITDLSGLSFNEANLSQVNLNGANLCSVNLTGANLRGAKLRGANFNSANLSRQNLSGFDLSGVNLRATNLHEVNLSNANLSRANLGGQNLSGFNLHGTNLTEVNFSGANLSGQNLNNFDLCGANFSKANLSKIQALETNFTAATFTGTCIEDWHINSATNLTNIICDYIYLRQKKQERRPSSSDFAPGEFTKLFQKSLETVDLIFRNGIDWDAFAYSFKKVEVE